MSEFKVEVVRIGEILTHANADRLDVIRIEGMGYTVVSAKGNLKPGDLAFYFPIDSVIPDEYVESFGIKPYYSKKLKAAKLRGVFSEGLLISVESQIELIKIAVGYGENLDTFVQVGDDYTEYFGVTKYQYPIPAHMGGDAEGHIGQYRFPSPEHLKRYPGIFTPKEQVYVSEKLHGTSFTIMVEPNGTHHIGSHNYFWKNNDTNNSNVYVRVYRENTILRALPPNTQVWGEIIGVQDIKYGLDKGRLRYAVFAVRQGDKILDYPEFSDFCDDFCLPTVPRLYIGDYYEGLGDKWNNENSRLHPESIMEGIVIQPLIERWDPEVGRVCMKRISDKYLLRKEGSELH